MIQNYIFIKFNCREQLLTFTHSSLGNGGGSGPVDGGAGQPQGAVAARPARSAARLPLQPRAPVAASARVPRHGAASLAAVRGSDRTRPGVAGRALLRCERTHQKQDIQEHDGAFAEHVSTKKQKRKKKEKRKEKPLQYDFHRNNPRLSDFDKPHEHATDPPPLTPKLSTLL